MSKNTTIQFIEDKDNEGFEKLVERIFDVTITRLVNSNNRDGLSDKYDVAYYLWEGDKSLGLLIHETRLAKGEIREKNISNLNYMITKFQCTWQDGHGNFSYSDVFQAKPGYYYPLIGCVWSPALSSNGTINLLAMPISEEIKIRKIL